MPRMDAQQLGRIGRALRIRNRLRQIDLSLATGVPRWDISLFERGHLRRLKLITVEAILGGVGARIDYRMLWNGPELDRLLDAGHAALEAVIKGQLERWGWLVRVEVSYSRYGERGRIDLLAFHPGSRILLVIEIKTALVDVQALLGSLDAKVRLAPHVAAPLGWQPVAIVPAIVFAENRTTRRQVGALGTLFDRYALRGRRCLSWLRWPADEAGSPPTGLLWFTSATRARAPKITGQRVRPRRRRPSAR